MHRVELKAVISDTVILATKQVPNAPCGVESLSKLLYFFLAFSVPNAPCGVERQKEELPFKPSVVVPNAPCGVERNVI